MDCEVWVRDGGKGMGGWQRRDLPCKVGFTRGFCPLSVSILPRVDKVIPGLWRQVVLLVVGRLSFPHLISSRTFRLCFSFVWFPTPN